MKYLLHSKKFRSTLSKWVFYYVITIALFTSVVTYSRYISSLTLEDSARVAKFDVKITFDCDESEEEDRNDKICELGSTRAKEINSFYFNVDTSNVEVALTIFTTITVDSNFSDAEVYIENNETNENGEKGWTKLNVAPDKDNKMILSDNINDPSTYKARYRIDCKLKNYENNYGNGLGKTKIVTVDYSATQID